MYDVEPVDPIYWLARLLGRDKLIRAEQQSGCGMQSVQCRKTVPLGFTDGQIHKPAQVARPFE